MDVEVPDIRHFRSELSSGICAASGGAQSADGVGGGGAECGKCRCEQGHQHHDEDAGEVDGRVSSADVEEERSDETGQGQRGKDSQATAEKSRLESGEEHEARERALEILSIFGNRLVPRVEHTVSSLSYANRRRVEIARALASDPKLLLLDEPTAGMNPAETIELADQIKNLNRLGLTIVLIEHKLDVVVSLAEKVIVLDHGEKIAEGTPAEVRRDEEVIRAYLGRSAAIA